MAGRVSLCRGAGEAGGGFVAVWLGGTAGAGGDVLGTPLVGVLGWLVGGVPFRAGVVAGEVGVVTAEFSVVGGRGLDDTILSRWLPPPPPQAARSATKAVDVVSRLSECLAAMMRIHCATKCAELVMEQSYSCRRAAVDASIKKHQRGQATGGALLPGGYGGHRWAVVAGALSLASILPAAFAPRAGLLEDVAVFQADGGEAAAPDAAGVQGDEVGLQSQAQR